MNTKNNSVHSFPSNSSRRRFLSGCAACAACMTFTPLASPAMASCSSAPSKKIRIRIIYALHAVIQPKPDWPNKGFDFGPVMGKTNTMLIKQFPKIEFLPVQAADKVEAEKILTGDKSQNIDGYIVFQMNCWNQVMQTMATSGKPLLYVDFQFGGSGGFLVYTSKNLKSSVANVGFVASSRPEDLIGAVKCFEVVQKGGTPAEFVAAVTKLRIASTPLASKLDFKEDNLQVVSTDECLQRMKNSKILMVPDDKPAPAEPMMGIPVEHISFSEVNKAWENADQDEARSIVERWQKKAQEIIDIPVETLQTSAAMYLGMKSVLKKHDANAITINCLGGFYGNHIHAYPCLGFHELDNEGLVGGCECDVRSAAAMTALNIMSNGRPGMISDPVIDTSKRQIIYAHCVAPSKVFGPQGPSNPFTIMTHSEDRQGASVRSILPADYLTTTVQIDQKRKEILFHQAKAVGNDPDDRACRTKLMAEPIGDMEKLFQNWDWGWHRVTIYGDLKEPVYALADKLGWKVVEEA